MRKENANGSAESAAEEAENDRGISKKRKKLFKIINLTLLIVIVLLFCFLMVKIFFVTTITVEQTSMFPTYDDGETIFVNRLGSVERGAVAVFFDDDVSVPRLASSFSFFSGSKLLLKRVVALAGDKIWLEATENGYVLQILCADSGETIDEKYADRDGGAVDLAPITLKPDTAGLLYDATRWDPYVVGADCFFAIGDNRPLSQDSRVFGDVPLSRIVGTALN